MDGKFSVLRHGRLNEKTFKTFIKNKRVSKSVPEHGNSSILDGDSSVSGCGDKNAS